MPINLGEVDLEVEEFHFGENGKNDARDSVLDGGIRGPGMRQRSGVGWRDRC